MNGYDCQRYEKLKLKVDDAGLTLELKGDQIFISLCGGFISVSDAFWYMCGYEHGKSKISISKLNRRDK